MLLVRFLRVDGPPRLGTGESCHGKATQVRGDAWSACRTDPARARARRDWDVSSQAGRGASWASADSADRPLGWPSEPISRPRYRRALRSTLLRPMAGVTAAGSIGARTWICRRLDMVPGAYGWVVWAFTMLVPPRPTRALSDQEWRSGDWVSARRYGSVVWRCATRSG